MIVTAKVWAQREGQAFLRALDGTISVLLDAETLEALKPVGVDVEEGDEVSLDVSIIRRTRPERTL